MESNWNKEKIFDLLKRNDVAVERAILAVYHRQTLDEQSDGNTKHSNGIGFSGAHAQLGTYYARWLLKGNRLTGLHLEKARKIAMRYTGQLLEQVKNKSKE